MDGHFADGRVQRIGRLAALEFFLSPAPDPSADIIAAGKQAIVFRQHFPPPHGGPGLSFFGGAPVASSGFRWPRPEGAGPQAKPLSFLMQIDCFEVPAPARLGMLPDRGVLYFFLDLTWAQPNAFRVLYAEGGANDWRAIEPPDDLGPAFGDHATFVWSWPQSADDCPRLLPTWTFQPMALTMWPDEKVMAEAPRRAQGEDVPSNWFSVDDFIDAQGGLRRPFEQYPHDWRAVQICSGLILHKTRHRPPSTHALRELPEAERAASPEAAARIPADVVRRVHHRHALAVPSAQGLFASTPDRMLAPPVDVQGSQADRAKTHLLLLELSSNEGLGHHFGEGVYQFWITPADLRARRFDTVELTADAY